MALLANIDTERCDIFSAMYGGYTGSVSLPQSTVLTSTFWDEGKIMTTLTPGFIYRNIPEPLRKRLDDQLRFGEGLTESNYGEWILEKTRKIFLILVESGGPEKIFDFIDGSWDDDDLPFTQDSLARLPLGSGTEKKFFKKQHLFMIRELEPGGHMDYDDDEVVPIEVIYHRIPAGRSHAAVEKVYFPRRRDIYYSRRRIPIADSPSESSAQISTEQFMDEIRIMRNLTHPHIASIYATYTQADYGYIVTSPTIDQNLRSFIQYPSHTYKALSKDRRKLLLIDWMHCLAEALAYLHEEGVAHGDIKPSSIIVDGANKIYLADIGNSNALYPRSAGEMDIERYEYGAPELWVRTMTSREFSPNNGVTISCRLRTRRRGQSDSSESPPNSPSSEKAVHLGAWRNPTTTDYWNSDVFSLACVYIDILTFYAKKKLSSFASHRACKNRRPRETAPPDASFHSNMGQVGSWLDGIEKRGKDKGDSALLGCVELSRDMLQRDRGLRPNSRRLEKELYKIVLGMTDEELPHCGMHTVVGHDVGLELLGGWDDGNSASSSYGEDVLGFRDVKPGSLEEKLWRFGSRRSTGSSGLFGVAITH